MQVEARFGPAEPMSQDGFFVRLLGGGPTKAGVAVSEYTALNFPVVYAAMNRIGNPLATFPVGIYQKSATGRIERVTQHPMSERLALRPNDYMSSRTLRKTTALHNLAWGNGYREIERNRKGQAVSLWPLLPQNTRPRKREGGDGIYIETNIAGERIPLDHGDVLHTMDLSQDGYVGMSPIALARQAIGMGLAMEEFGAKFFANDLKSGGFLMHPGRLGPKATSNVRGEGGRAEAAPENPASRLERQGGLENAHRIKVLEEGMKFIPTSVPPEDAQFLGSREFQIAEIARIFDVPLVLLQSHEKSTSWGSGIEQLMIGFIQQTIAPWVTADEQELNWKLFTEEERKAGLYVKYNMKGLLRGDSAARAALYKAMFETGAFSPNRILQLEDEEGLGDDGDHTFVPVNFQTLEQAVDGPPPTPQPARVPTPPPAIDDSEEDDA